jgi:hypothetical protein
VRIVNTGNQPTGELTITITGDDGFSPVSQLIASIPAGGYHDFAVSTSLGLSANIYTATVTVATAEGNDNPVAAQSFDVIFEVMPLQVQEPTEFIGSNPNILRQMLDGEDVILNTRGNLGIFVHHSPFVIPEGRTLIVRNVLNVQGNAELVIKGTVVVEPGGRINNQGGLGGTITIAPGGVLENNGHVENVTNSAVYNHGTIVNNARFEVRANVTFSNEGIVGGTNPLNIHRNAIHVGR